jgi:lysophospholipase L1-like esterase
MSQKLNPSAQLKQLICFGDSLTYGESADYGCAWFDLLKQQSSAMFDRYYNLAIAGETSDGLKLRFKQEFDSRYIKGYKNTIVLAYGINDLVIHSKNKVLHTNKNVVPVEYFISNLSAAIDYAKFKRCEVLMINIAPFAEQDDGQCNIYDQVRFQANLTSYNLALQQLSLDKNITLVDVVSRFKRDSVQSYLADDGLHLNNYGHQLVYQQLRSVIL